MPDVRSCADDRVVADLGACFDDYVRLDRHAFSELSARIDDRAWVNPWREGDRFRREFEHNLLECFGWIGDANLTGGNRLGEIRRNEHCGGARSAQESNVFSVHKKTDLTGGRFRERRSAGDFESRIADQLAAEHCREFLESKGHGQVKALKREKVSATPRFGASGADVFR